MRRTNGIPALLAALVALAGAPAAPAADTGPWCPVEAARSDGGAYAVLRCTEGIGLVHELPGSRQPLSFARPPAPEAGAVGAPDVPIRSDVRPGTDLRADVRRGNLFRTDLFLAGRWIPPAPPPGATLPRRDRPSPLRDPVVPAGPTPRVTLVPPPEAFRVMDFRMPGAPAYDPGRGARRLYLDGTPGF